MCITKDQIIEAVAAMSVVDVVDLITEMEKKFGVSADYTKYTSSANTTDVETKIVEEKTEFNIVLSAIGSNKIAVIKAVRSITGLGLKEAKDLVESAPALLKEGLNKHDAEGIKKSLEDAGATVEVK